MAGFGTWNLKWFFFHFLLGFIQTAFSWWLQAPKLNLDGRECRFFPTNVRGHSNRASLVVFVRWNSESPAGFRWFQHVKMVWERKIAGMILESTLHCVQLVPHFFLMEKVWLNYIGLEIWRVLTSLRAEWFSLFPRQAFCGCRKCGLGCESLEKISTSSYSNITSKGVLIRFNHHGIMWIYKPSTSGWWLKNP